jgi:hypothetical protein
MNHYKKHDRPSPYSNKKKQRFDDCVAHDLSSQHRKFCLRTLLSQFATPKAREASGPTNDPLSTGKVLEIAPSQHSLLEKSLTHTLERQIRELRGRLCLKAS